MVRKRDPQAEAYAALRRRGKAEIKKLGQEFKGMTTEQQRGARGQAILQQQQRIEEVSRRTYLGRKATQQTRLEAREASNELQAYLGRKGERGRKQQQARRDRIYRQQIRVEEAGGESGALFRGTAGRYHYERIFYMSTQAMWRGLSNQERDAAIIKKLGVSSLEEAYELVIGGNMDVIVQIAEAGVTGGRYDAEKYDIISAYVEDIYDILADRL